MNCEQLHLPLKVLRHVQCSAAPDDDPNHHLRRITGGYWQFHITVDRGPQCAGPRVIVDLRTRRVKEARARRDLVLATMRRAQIVAEQTSAANH